MTDAPTILRQPIESAAAWRGPDLTPSDYLYELDAEQVAAWLLYTSDAADEW